jgi:hypothetical protein
MNSKLSVFETMQEMLRLSAKHFRLLLVVGAAQSVPGIASQVSSQVMSQLGFAALGSLLAFVLYIEPVPTAGHLWAGAEDFG